MTHCGILRREAVLRNWKLRVLMPGTTSFMRNLPVHNTLVIEWVSEQGGGWVRMWVGECVIGSHFFSEVAPLPLLRQGLDGVVCDVPISNEMDTRLPCLRYVVVYMWRHNPLFPYNHLGERGVGRGVGAWTPSYDAAISSRWYNSENPNSVVASENLSVLKHSSVRWDS